MVYNPPIPKIYKNYASWVSKKIRNYNDLNKSIEEKIYYLELKQRLSSKLSITRLKRRIEANNKRIEALRLFEKEILKQGKEKRG